MRGVRTGGLLAAAALPILAACATTQEVPLPCVTEEMLVYVDGQLLEGRPESIELGLDAPHKLYVKRPGHRPRLVVLVPEETEDGARLVPEDVCLEIAPVALDRELSVEVEEPPADTGP